MKQIMCEVCGSTDMAKSDGMFICQACGCKYTLEAVRQLIVEMAGPVDVTGSTVKVDQSQKLDNLISAARLSTSNKNYETAAAQWGEVLAMDPQNWEACYYSMQSNALIRKIGHRGPSDEDFSAIRETLDETVELIKDGCESEEACFNAVKTISKGIATLTKAGISEGNRLDAEDKRIYGSTNQGYWRHQKVESGRVYCSYGRGIFRAFKNDNRMLEFARETVQKGLSELEAANAEGTKALLIQYKGTVKAINKAIEDNNDKATSEAFWKVHAEEKVRLEKEKEELENELKRTGNDYQNEYERMMNEIDKVRESFDSDVFEKQIKLLEEEKNAIGLMSFSKRRMVSEEIDKVKQNREKAQEECDKKINSLWDQIQEMEEKKNRTKETLDKRLDDINSKLKKGYL